MINKVEKTGDDEYTIHSTGEGPLVFMLLNLKANDSVAIEKTEKTGVASADYSCKITSKDLVEILNKYSLSDF